MLRKVVHAWEAIQVERHGRYSIERLHALSAYCGDDANTPARIAFIMLLTPLPCLSAILLADSLPLSSPGQGIAHNKIFWLRAFIAAWFYTISFVVQFSQSLPMLPMSRNRILATTWVVRLGGTAIVMPLSLAVGFPMPFMMVLATPGWILFLVGSLAAQWGSTIRADPSVWPRVTNCLKVFSIQMSLLVVYPVYNFFFQNLEGTKQALFSLVLHVIKIAAKNAIGRYFTHMEDMRPEVVIFNVEVFSALFTAFCMQNASSLLTTLILVISDFIHACLSLYEVNELLKELDALEVAMREKAMTPHSTEPSHDTSQHSRTQAVCSRHTMSSGDSILLRTMDLLSRPGRITDKQLGLVTRSSIWGSPAWSERNTSMGKSPTFLSRCAHWMGGKMGNKVGPSGDVSQLTAILTPQALKKASAQTRRSVIPNSGNDLIQSRGLLSKMTPLMIAEHQYVEKVLELLYLTEFTILVEYTEVIIPIVYSVYLMIVPLLSNYVYYPQLAELDRATLYQNVYNVLLYSALEMLSFVVLQHLLKQRLRLSASLQLAFVLEGQWQMVQSKLVLWVLYIVQASLVHFGVDYTFQFKWLHEKQYTWT